MTPFGLFILGVVLTNLVFGGITAAFLLRFNERLQFPSWPLALAGFGLGPYLMTVVLYYALVIFPGSPHWVLFGMPVLFFVLLAWRSGSGWRVFRALLRGSTQLVHDRSMWFFAAGSLFILAITYLFLANKPLVDHDVLEYGIQGRIFFRDGAIHYAKHRFDAGSGFYYVGLHGFSFPLLFTWEALAGSLFGVKGDLWARSITMWYGWLLVAFCWSYLRRIDRWVAVAASIALTCSLGFLFLITIYHLDSYRIFFFVCAMSVFVALFQSPSVERVILLAALCGAFSFIHSIGAIMSAVLWGVVFLLIPVRLPMRLRWTCMAICVMLALGSVHYVLDILFGTGWILQDIIWY